MYKRILAGLLAALMMLAAIGAVAEGYRVQDGNIENVAALLVDLVGAYETPSAGDADRIDEDLAAIRAVSEADYGIASAVAAHWRAVYLDADYPLYMHSGGQRAVELEQADLGGDDIQAIVVLGYELKDGQMTDELKGRCEAAAAVARSFPDAIIICSGGATGDNNPDGYTEAGMMRAWLSRKCGIAATRIHIDENAMTTVDNAVNTFAILREQGVQTMTIVTSSYHQRWGQAIYNAVGAICRQSFGYSAQIVGNYCYETEPSDERFRRDDRIAARQLAMVLGLPRDALDNVKR